MIQLYEFPISGNCYKIRLFLSLLGVEYKSCKINGAEREHKANEFLTLNPFGQVPVLVDGDIIIRDSHAILVYLARAYGGDNWFPSDAIHAAEITAWLSTSANEVARGPSALRAHYKIGRTINIDDAISVTENLLHVLNNHLEKRDWLAAGKITIADITMYPYMALANEGKIDITPFTHICRWLRRIEMLKGFVSMPGIQLQTL